MIALSQNPKEISVSGFSKYQPNGKLRSIIVVYQRWCLMNNINIKVCHIQKGIQAIFVTKLTNYGSWKIRNSLYLVENDTLLVLMFNFHNYIVTGFWNKLFFTYQMGIVVFINFMLREFWKMGSSMFEFEKIILGCPHYFDEL